MKLVTYKCESCGAAIERKEEDNKVICPYCGTPYYIEGDTPKKANNNFEAKSEQKKGKSYVPLRPEVNKFWFLMGLIFYVFPAVLYFVYNEMQDAKWEKEYMCKEYAHKYRPQIDGFIMIMSLIFGVAPGVAYIAYMIYKQHEWDKKYSN